MCCVIHVPLPPSNDAGPDYFCSLPSAYSNLFFPPFNDKYVREGSSTFQDDCFLIVSRKENGSFERSCCNMYTGPLGTHEIYSAIPPSRMWLLLFMTS